MSNRSWSLLGLAAILILAGNKALIVLAMALTLLLLQMIAKLVIFMVKSMWRWVFGK